MEVAPSDLTALQQKLNLAHNDKLNIRLDKVENRGSLSSAKKYLGYCNKKEWHESLGA